ncbi:MAG: hypothetical protein ACRDL7_05715 [Gaiellaceae bacterium]
MRDTRDRHLTQSLTLRLSDRLATQLSAAARADDRTASEYVRELLRRELLQRGDVSETQR